MEHYYWIGLKAVPGIGNVAFRRLLERFDSPELALKASPADLSGIRGIHSGVIEGIKSGAWRRFAEEECRRLEASAARLVTYVSHDYPKSLFEIPDPPPFLYVKASCVPMSFQLPLSVHAGRHHTGY